MGRIVGCLSQSAIHQLVLQTELDMEEGSMRTKGGQFIKNLKQHLM